MLAAAVCALATLSPSLCITTICEYITAEWAPQVAGFLNGDVSLDFWAPFMAADAILHLRHPNYATFYTTRGRQCWAVNITKYAAPLYIFAMLNLYITLLQHI
jgi:hypothetical protein